MFDDSMGFSTYNDFFKRRDIIKKKYKSAKREIKDIYKMYVYSQRHLSRRKVDLIWEYLNEPDTSVDCPTKEQLEMYFVQALEKKDEDYKLEGEDFEY